MYLQSIGSRSINQKACIYNDRDHLITYVLICPLLRQIPAHMSRYLFAAHPLDWNHPPAYEKPAAVLLLLLHNNRTKIS